VSVLGCCNFGSSLSVRSFVRVGSAISVRTEVKFSDNTYIKHNSPSPSLELYAGGARAITITDSGGTLHGVWQSDNPVITSDRRLKTEIKPLQRTLRGLFESKQAAPESMPGPSNRGIVAPKAEQDRKDEKGALWMLRQLRPVSYFFKKGPESKYMRFGFIADELETVVPQVVRNMGQKEYADEKAVVYQDLIALLTSAAQGQQQVIEKQQDRMEKLLSDFKMLKDELGNLKQDDQLELPKNLHSRNKKPKKKKHAKTKSLNTNLTNSTNSTKSVYAPEQHI